ncbi:MAG: hypothetical protein M1816_001483 [Peltula sp. TS41687]|nr:MAG: hypothetical protein M1816_001483 [Peltula sp. TS41687]
MSGYGDRQGYSGRDDRSRRRSVSPRGDRRDPRRDDRSYTGGESRYSGRRDGRDDSAQRGRYGGRGSDGGSTSYATTSSGASLPSTVPVPSTGRQFNPLTPPMKGTIGKPTRILVNHYEIQSLPTVKTHTYEIRMRVPVSSQRRGKSEVSAAQLDTVMRQDAVKAFFKDNFVFDGVSLGWSTTELLPINETRSTMIDLPGSTPDRPNEVEIQFRNVGTVNILALVKYIMEKRIELDPMGNKEIEPTLKWLNAVYRQDPASKWVTRPGGSAYYDRAPGTFMSLRSTADVLEAVRGIYQTVQLRFGKLTINVDTATTAFWAPGKNLIELVHALMQVPPHANIQDVFVRDPQRFFSQCERLVGIFFNVRHLSERRNARKVKLNKWTRGNAMELEFSVNREDNSVTTNVNDYYRDRYNINLRYPQLPLADTKDGWFPLELCFSASGERYKEVLQGAETADFIKFATAPANVRQQQITANVEKLQWHNLDTPKTMGLSVKTQMLQVSGRILPSPTPQYSSGTDTRSPEMGSWNLRGKRFARPSAIKSWGLMYIPAGAGAPMDAVQDLVGGIQRGFGTLGMNVPRDLPAFLRGNAQGDIAIMVAELFSKANAAFGTKPDLLMFLIHGASDRIYKAVKNACDIQFGVASQVMLVEKAMNKRGQVQYIANIGLKANVKLGGMNSVVEDPLLRNSRWMLLGGDTSHPSPAQLRMNPPPPTFSALTATWDNTCTAYTAVASAQLGKDQMITDFALQFEELLKRYKEKNNGSTPNSILYYRDGLSESQFAAIMAQEVGPLKEACAAISGPKPKITVVVCIKRHHTRMFPTERGDKLGNVLPGTVVENSPNNDIYLVAHGGLQGTVRPTRYVVLFDQNNLSADDFQRLTNNLAWTYARATRAVSVVPPVYYADQACERARLHLRENAEGVQYVGLVHDDLKYSMYWQ